MKHDKRFEDLDKVPLEAVIKQLEKEIKQLMLESGQRESYILELEDEKKALQSRVTRLEDEKESLQSKVTSKIIQEIYSNSEKEEVEERLVIQLKQANKQLKITISNLRTVNNYIIGELLKYKTTS